MPGEMSTEANDKPAEVATNLDRAIKVMEQRRMAGFRPSDPDNSTERAQVYALIAIAEKLGHINHALELLVDQRLLDK